MEALIYAHENIAVDNDDLDEEIKAVEAGSAVIPGWVGDGARGVVDADAEAGAEGDEEG
jgi:hypothetical protein